MAEWVNNWLVNNIPVGRRNRYFIFGYKDYIYGATTNINNWQYLYRYDLRTNTWSDTPVATAPDNCAFTPWQDYSNNINIIFGEEILIKLVNRTSGQDYYGIYNVRLNKWTHLTTSGTSGGGSEISYFNNSSKRIYTVRPSGYAGDYHDEVYIYDMKTNVSTTTPRILGSYASNNEPDIKGVFEVDGKIYVVMIMGSDYNKPYQMYVYSNGSWSQKGSKTANNGHSYNLNFLEYSNNVIYWYDYNNVIYSYNTSTDTWYTEKTKLCSYNGTNGGSRCNCNGLYLFFINGMHPNTSFDNCYVLYDYKNDKIQKFTNMPINLGDTYMWYKGCYYNGLACFNLCNEPQKMLFYKLGDYTFDNTAPTIPSSITHGAFTKKTINDQVIITWGASTDKENDLITYELYFFNGDSWVAIASGLTDLIYKYIIPSTAYNTTSAKFKVCATDGFASSEFIESSVFEIYGANILNSPPEIKGEVIYN